MSVARLSRVLILSAVVAHLGCGVYLVATGEVPVRSRLISSEQTLLVPSALSSQLKMDECKISRGVPAEDIKLSLEGALLTRPFGNLWDGRAFQPPPSSQSFMVDFDKSGIPEVAVKGKLCGAHSPELIIRCLGPIDRCVRWATCARVPGFNHIPTTSTSLATTGKDAKFVYLSSIHTPTTYDCKSRSWKPVLEAVKSGVLSVLFWPFLFRTTDNVVKWWLDGRPMFGLFHPIRER